MAKFLVELWLDGYDSEEEMEEAAKDFIEEQLDFSASEVKVRKLTEEEAKNITYTMQNNHSERL